MNAMDSVLTYENETFDTQELYNVLGFSTVPTDRELEAKIIQMIQKYSYYEDSSEYESDKSFYFFFHQVYDFFFTTVSSEEEESETMVEGFTNADLKTEVDILRTNKGKLGEKIDKVNEEMEKPKSENILPVTKNVEYTKDVVNPILKQTIQRTIVIDSQRRHLFSSNSFTNSISTDFTVEIEPLKDVLSLKLFSYHIPYTWYTVNRDYGSNFFYLKGTSPGLIDCGGKYDFQVSILPGNYTPVQLKDAINNSFTEVTTKYTDVSFGTTHLDYNINNTKASFTIDIQNIYHESQHSMDWINWTSSDQPNRENNLHNIPVFLGYDSQTYDINTVYSLRDKLGKPNNNNDVNDTSFHLSVGGGDISNNYFQIIHYLNPLTQDGDYYQLKEYVEGTSQIIDTITIQLSGITQSGNYSRNFIQAELEKQILNSSYLVKGGEVGSYLKRIEQTGGTFSYYKMNLTVDRTKVKPVAHSKYIVVFPNESNISLLSNNSNLKPIWTNITNNSNNSCFCFNPDTFELNNLLAEFPLYDSNYILKNDAYIELICNSTGYTDPSNNFLMKIPKSPNQKVGYNLTQYKDAINTAVLNPINYLESKYADVFVNNPPTRFEIDKNSIPQIYLDFNMYFKNKHYNIFFNDVSLNSVSLYTQRGYELSVNNLFPSNSIENVTNYTFEDHNKPLFSIIPKYNNAARFDVSFNNRYGTTISGGYRYNYFEDFKRDYIDSIKNFMDVSGESTPLVDSLIDFILVPATNTYRIDLTIQVSKKLSQRDYVMHLYDLSSAGVIYPGSTMDMDISSSWHDFLNYNSYEYLLKNYNVSSYTNVSGSDIITGKTITIVEGSNNYFFFKPQSYAEGLVTYTAGKYYQSYFNDIYVNIPADIYSNISLFNALNKAFSENLLTRGTYIESITKNGVQYCKLRVNINHIFTAEDYIIDFYDVVSFVKCYVGSSGVRNTTWDTTLGWILGFHEQTSYALFMYTRSNTNPIADISGETSVNVNLYKYFLISLDDFNQNRLNDGIVTITNPESKIPLPSYSAIAKYTCDSNGKIGTSGSLETASNNLTVNQIYALNQIISSQQSLLKVYSQGPYVKDIFGIIPFKIPSNQGETISEFGGTLQNQERKYFGPVNIRRLQIQLYNDQGNIMDLNGDWSFSLICEQLYQHSVT